MSLWWWLLPGELEWPHELAVLNGSVAALSSDPRPVPPALGLLAAAQRARQDVDGEWQWEKHWA